jgi:hypothetical protein
MFANNLQVTLIRSMAVALFSAVIAGTWDAWWHGALGRESFWSPPHFLLYASIITAIVLGIYGWYRTREKLWRHLAIFLALVPISAPFDELWHRIFGIESVASPLIVWSPPHVVLIVAISGSLLMILPVLRRDENRDAQRLFGSLVFASVLSLLMFLVAPVQPHGGLRASGILGCGRTCRTGSWHSPCGSRVDSWNRWRHHHRNVLPRYYRSELRRAHCAGRERSAARSSAVVASGIFNNNSCSIY